MPKNLAAALICAAGLELAEKSGTEGAECA